MGQLSKIEEELTGLGYQILAISPDRPEKLRVSLDKLGLEYSLLSDSDMTASRAFGLAYRVDDETFEALKGYGLDIEEASGRTHRLLPVPAALVVGTDGVIRFRYFNPDYRVRIEPDALLEAARSALQD